MCSVVFAVPPKARHSCGPNQALMCTRLPLLQALQAVLRYNEGRATQLTVGPATGRTPSTTSPGRWQPCAAARPLLSPLSLLRHCLQAICQQHLQARPLHSTSAPCPPAPTALQDADMAPTPPLEPPSADIPGSAAPAEVGRGVTPQPGVAQQALPAGTPPAPAAATAAAVGGAGFMDLMSMPSNVVAAVGTAQPPGAQQPMAAAQQAAFQQQAMPPPYQQAGPGRAPQAQAQGAAAADVVRVWQGPLKLSDRVRGPTPALLGVAEVGCGCFCMSALAHALGASAAAGRASTACAVHAGGAAVPALPCVLHGAHRLS